MKATRLLSPFVMTALVGCALLPNSPAGQDAMKGAQVALTAYADIYQPAVLAYGRLPACPGATLCHDTVILGKLKAADAAVTQTIVAAKGVMDGNLTDTGQIAAAMSAIQTAEVQIAGSGAMTATK